ncbi:CHAD domain-containing protein [Mucilaginibacter sp.]|jgi:CHAD domain-containing protein|uniref:CHAD domain-containing protein n=1 Tax=Mucilaginibacter sp. TaxID=1882438 RepID=UPI002B650F85|nr:CHAD domain-containing protein [Mucilaginibacter sp.]HTI57534.1 CHAD domain-containing protein [Mucilaginibacter sp.]
MKRKAGKAYFNELWYQMKSDLRDFIKTGDQEKLHHFRVQVKKLRAFLLLVDHTLPHSKLSGAFKPIRRIFKDGGRIREAYLNLQLSSKYGLQNDDFILQQVNGMDKDIKAFMDNSKQYLKTVRTVHAGIEDGLKAVEGENISEFYKGQLEQITVTLHKLEFNEGLHECRKRIKTLLYNRKIAAEALESSLQIDNDYLDKLQEGIGQWHDSLLAIGLFSSPGINDRTVIAKIKRQNARQRKSISNLAHDFWKKATLTEKAINNGQEVRVWV